MPIVAQLAPTTRQNSVVFPMPGEANVLLRCVAQYEASWYGDLYDALPASGNTFANATTAGAKRDY
jgi:cell fate regulator YaaT (PSP1 superfamily)